MSLLRASAMSLLAANPCSVQLPSRHHGASPETLTELGVSRVMMLTSTYDHRVIQGAVSGEFLKVMHELIIGQHGFYDEIYKSLNIDVDDAFRILRGCQQQVVKGAEPRA